MCDLFVILLSPLIGFAWALDVASMTLSVASLATVMCVLSLENTNSLSTETISLLHTVAMWLLTLSKVLVRGCRPSRLSSFNFIGSIMPLLWMVFPGFVWMGLVVLLSSLAMSH